MKAINHKRKESQAARKKTKLVSRDEKRKIKEKQRELSQALCMIFGLFYVTCLTEERQS